MASKYKQKGSSYWWTKYYKDGQMVRKSLKTRDRKVADYLINKIEAEFAEGRIPPEIRDVNMQEALKEYLEFSSAYKTKRTFEEDKLKLQKFLERTKIIKLKSITRKTVENYLAVKIKEDEIKPITANGILSTIKTFLNWCVRQHYLPSNPVKDIKKFKIPENPPRFLTQEEICSLLKAAKESEIYPLIATALYTGLRRGELLNLEWPDIDFSKNIIQIVNKPGFTIKSKKFRIIPIVPALRKILLSYRKDNGSCFLQVNLRKNFAKVIKKVGLNDVGLHSLRHTFASQLVMKGVDLVTIKELLGHQDLSTTMIYSHLTNDHIAQAINRLDFSR